MITREEAVQALADVQALHYLGASTDENKRFNRLHAFLSKLLAELPVGQEQGKERQEAARRGFGIET